MGNKHSLTQEPELRIVLVGRTGVGKSASGNTILRRRAFESRFCSSSVTAVCQKERGEFEGQTLAVVDTPGLFDTRITEDEVKTEVARSISLSAPGPHVILVVIRLDRFTHEEQKTVRIIQEMFREDAAPYTMVLFTRGDVLQSERVSIDTFIGQSQALNDFVRQCEGGYHVFNNRNKSKCQVRELLKKINRMVQSNGRSCYTNVMFQEAERAISEEMERLQREDQNMTREEARRRAERNNTFIQNVQDAAVNLAALGATVAGPVGAAVAGPVGAAVGTVVGAAVGAAIGAAVVIVREKVCIIQ